MLPFHPYQVIPSLFSKIESYPLRKIAEFSLLPFYYARGCSIYATDNTTPQSPQSCLKSLDDEINELIEAIGNLNLVDIVLEGADVVHATVKYIAVSVLPKDVYCHYFFWLFLFPFILPCTIKLALRYRNNGCIRNHGNVSNCDHICSINKNN